MKTITDVIKTLCIVGITALTTSGCASTRVNLVDTGVVSLERVPSEGTYITRVYAHKEGNGLVISGKVKKEKNASIAPGGYVDITILSPNGTIIKKISANYTPRIIRRKGARESAFSVRFFNMPPQGAKIRVAYRPLIRHQQPIRL